MPKSQIKASVLIDQLKLLIGKHGDLPVMVAIPDEGTFDIEIPQFDTDGAGDNCFII